MRGFLPLLLVFGVSLTPGCTGQPRSISDGKGDPADQAMPTKTPPTKTPPTKTPPTKTPPTKTPPTKTPPMKTPPTKTAQGHPATTPEEAQMKSESKQCDLVVTRVFDATVEGAWKV